jgi:Protein of unknown function (DUF3302)
MKKREVAPLASPGRRVAPETSPARQHPVPCRRGIGPNHMDVPAGPVRVSGVLVAVLAIAGLCLSSSAHASLLTPEQLDVAAFYLAWFIVIVFPIVGIVLFLMVHMLPEKIAERRQHPQKEAIKTLTILSLIFGGMLWPICWLWAYVRPTGYRAVYGTTKHEDYYYEMGEKALAGKLSEDELAQVREEIDAMADTGTLPLKLKLLRKELQAAPAGPVAAQAVPPAGSGSKAGSD